MKSGLDSKMKLALELASMLERISVDSYWAHRASGLRVALLRLIDRLEARRNEVSLADIGSLDVLVEQGYWILENAARELRGKS
jgi:hypothetical protein